MRPRVDLDPFKDEIIGLFHQKHTTEIICALMKQRHSLDLSDGTLSRRLREWGLRRLPPKTINDAALRDRIQSLVRDGLSDKEIVTVLRREEGFSQISQSKVSKTRRKLGLRLRTDDPQARMEQEAEIEEVIRREIEQGEIEGYGRRLLHSHLRAKGHVFPRYVYRFDHRIQKEGNSLRVFIH
jgi:arginine repressor